MCLIPQLESAGRNPTSFLLQIYPPKIVACVYDSYSCWSKWVSPCGWWNNQSLGNSGIRVHGNIELSNTIFKGIQQNKKHLEWRHSTFNYFEISERYNTILYIHALYEVLDSVCHQFILWSSDTILRDVRYIRSPMHIARQLFTDSTSTTSVLLC